MSNWAKHCELIRKYCDVKCITENAIWFYDCGIGYCELRTGESYLCNDWETFRLLAEE